MMLTAWITSQLLKLGIPKQFHTAAQWIIVAVAAVAIIFAAKAIYDAGVVEDYENDRALESIDARDDAAEQRANDTIQNTINEKELHDAIDAAPTGGTLSPAALALSCERLRRRGGELPAACRSHSGDGSEAGAD